MVTEQQVMIKKKVPDWEGERIGNWWDEGETQDEKGVDFLKLILKDEIFEVYIGVGDTEVPRGIDPIWCFRGKMKECCKRREGLEVGLAKLPFTNRLVKLWVSKYVGSLKLTASETDRTWIPWI